MVILKSVCVCDMGKKGEGLAKTVMRRPGHVSVFFFSLPLFELEIKDTTDTIKEPAI
jgi:hypothetical protein